MGISPENGVTISKIRKSAPDAETAQTRKDAMTTGLGGTNRLKLPKIMASQNISRTRNGRGIEFSACA
jgi:hypothetical protein